MYVTIEQQLATLLQVRHDLMSTLTSVGQGGWVVTCGFVGFQ